MKIVNEVLKNLLKIKNWNLWWLTLMKNNSETLKGGNRLSRDVSRFIHWYGVFI